MSLERELQDALAALETRRQRRVLPTVRGAAAGIDFTSNDYLGLARSPRLTAAAQAALAEHGAGGRAARLLGGGSPLEAELEAAVADWLSAEAALFFPSGYQANVGLVAALAGPGDVVVADALAHASLIDGARLSRALVLVHEHGSADDLARQLAQPAARAARRRLVLTESVFSMDGDAAPLEALLDVCERHDAHLVVDEAHACGLLGPRRAGLAAPFARSPRLAARLVTGGKSFGCGGALVVGSRALVGWLTNRARSFVFTTAASPAVPAAFLAAVAAVRADGTRSERALANARTLAQRLGLPEPAAAIVPFVLGDDAEALAAAEAVRAAGCDVRAVRPPTVPDGTARLRLVCRADHTDADLERLVRSLAGYTPRAVAVPAPKARPLVIAGTDTGIGKTVVSALLLRALAALRPDAAYWKPVQTGDDDDTTTVQALAERPAATFRRPRHALPLPASPHEAAHAAGVRIDPAAIAHDLAALPGATIAELAGGLLVPLDDATTQLDVLARVRPRLVLVARSGLGTLNHTLLSLEALRRRRLEPEALFLVGPPHPSNRATLQAMGGIARVFEVPPFAPLDGAALQRWIDAHDLAWLAP